jgi:hypothetical protein
MLQSDLLPYFITEDIGRHHFALPPEGKKELGAPARRRHKVRNEIWANLEITIFIVLHNTMSRSTRRTTLGRA